MHLLALFCKKETKWAEPCITPPSTGQLSRFAVNALRRKRIEIGKERRARVREESLPRARWGQIISETFRASWEGRCSPAPLRLNPMCYCPIQVHRQAQSIPLAKSAFRQSGSQWSCVMCLNLYLVIVNGIKGKRARKKKKKSTSYLVGHSYCIPLMSAAQSVREEVGWEKLGIRASQCWGWEYASLGQCDSSV